ncbi:MAG TPA: patatin-like phospholipase family protein [Longimicrobiales bacterium]|nr:patatin-like phospholipase family protein [Longimicrobiales bacterium]
MAEIGLVLTGGGARGAYQVGVLSWIARRYPELDLPILTGVSAGAVNAAKLASRFGTFAQSVEELRGLWSELQVEDVFRVAPWSIAWSAFRWGSRLTSGGGQGVARVQGLLDTTPLRELLEEVMVTQEGVLSGVDYNLERGALKSVAIVTASYTTSQSVVWVQGRDIAPWTRPNRRAVQTKLRIDHIMASAALPLFFPAVEIQDPAVGAHWYGDGGMRLSAPLSPALHLGADRVLAISTRYDRAQQEVDAPVVTGYPPPAQVLGLLLNSVFLDLIDQDVMRLERLNSLLVKLPPEERNGLRPIRILTIRPSQDLARMAAGHELDLPWAFRFMTRGLGTRETRSPDILAMLMFNPLYLQEVMELGERDAEANAHELERFIEDEVHP